MNATEQTHRKDSYLVASRKAAVGILLAHIPVMALAGWYFETGVLLGIGLCALIASGPTVLLVLAPRSQALTVSIGIAATSMSGLLIHLGGGMLEMHFHVFVAIAALVGIASVWAVVASAATIAVHHLLFFFLMPDSVFNYEASLGIVILHAVFVVAESIPIAFICRKFSQFIAARDVMSEQLDEITEAVNYQTTSVSSSSSDLANAATRLWESLGSTSKALSDVSSCTRANASSASAAMERTGRAREVAESVANEIKTMNDAMTEIRESSDSIAQIIKSIDEIAFQTNILALNAAVEAARAGEAGAGFAVVADEVRNLAQRSAKAAKETAERIEGSVTRSERGARISQRVSVQLQQIFEIAREVDEIVSQIAKDSQDQSDKIQEANTDIERVTEESASIADGNGKHSEELLALARQMSGVMLSIEDALGGSTNALANKSSRIRNLNSIHAAGSKPENRAAANALEMSFSEDWN